MNKDTLKPTEESFKKPRITDELKATPTNPFEGERRQLHNAWMKVVGEGNLTSKLTNK